MPTLFVSRRSVLAASVAGAVLLAAGCGGSSDSSTSADVSPTTEWADGLCSAINTYTESLTQIVDPIKSGDISEDSLTAAVDDAKGATETFTSDLEGLGAPDTEAGQEAKNAVDELSTELESAVQTIEQELEGASGIAGFIAAAPAVLTALGTMGTSVTSTVTDLQGIDAKGELESAFADASSCGDLTGG